MQSDGTGHGFRTRVVKTGEQHIAHKNLRALGDVEDDIHLAGVGGLGLLGDIDAGLLEAAAEVFG